MKPIPCNEVSKDIHAVLDLVKKGEEVIIKNDQDQENLAVIISYEKYKTRHKRPLGVLKGKAGFKLKDDFEITDEEILDL